MKIALLTPNKVSYSETFINNHIKHLPFDKVVIYGGDIPSLTEGFSLSKSALWRFKIKNFIAKKTGKPTIPLASYRLQYILKKEKVDLVFCEYIHIGANVTSICKRLQLPLVTIGLGYEVSMYHMLETHKQAYQRLFDYASTIFVVAQAMKKNIIPLGCPEEKVIWTPAGPDASFFELTPHFTTPQFFAIGRFVDKKAPHQTILAFHKVYLKYPKSTLVMAGDGELLDICKDLVKAHKLESAVTFLGRIDQDKQRSFLQNSLAFVQHSRVAASGDSEGTPVAILEASAAGLPVIATFHSGIPEVVQHNTTGLLSKENDIDAMSQHMIQLIENPQKAKQIGTAGREFVKENFTLQRHIDTIAQAMKKAMQYNLNKG